MCADVGISSLTGIHDDQSFVSWLKICHFIPIIKYVTDVSSADADLRGVFFSFASSWWACEEYKVYYGSLNQMFQITRKSMGLNEISALTFSKQKITSINGLVNKTRNCLNLKNTLTVSNSWEKIWLTVETDISSFISCKESFLIMMTVRVCYSWNTIKKEIVYWKFGWRIWDRVSHFTIDGCNTHC